MRLGEYLDKFCWSQSDLARAAGISEASVKRALVGEKLSRRVAAKIVEAISNKNGKPVLLPEIEGLRIAGYRTRRKSKPVDQAVPSPTPATRRQKIDQPGG